MDAKNKKVKEQPLSEGAIRVAEVRASVCQGCEFGGADRINTKRRQVRCRACGCESVSLVDGACVKAKWRTAGVPMGATDLLENQIHSIKALDEPRGVDAYTFFDRVVCVNLDRRPDRWQEFASQDALNEWPFRPIERVAAWDGRKQGPPPWFQGGGGAWGCMMSHFWIITHALQHGLKSVLVFEDDAVLANDFGQRAIEFLQFIPEDWDQIYFGGQHLYDKPIRLNDHVCAPSNVNRTHAFAMSEAFMRVVYRHMLDFADHMKNPAFHVDHRLGQLHESRKYKVYCPITWMAAQREGKSDITGRPEGRRDWHSETDDRFVRGELVKPQDIPVAAPKQKAVQSAVKKLEHSEPLVLVVGLHRSGSSMMAGIVAKLGVYFGDRFTGYEEGGGYEEHSLQRLCEKMMRFPSQETAMSNEEFCRLFGVWAEKMFAGAQARHTLPGAKYPHLCKLAPLVKQVVPNLKVIHINRPVGESIASLISRVKRDKEGWAKGSTSQLELLQRHLAEQKEEFLQGQDHITVEYHDMLIDPAREVQRIIEYLKLDPPSALVRAAIDHVQPGKRTVDTIKRPEATTNAQ